MLSRLLSVGGFPPDSTIPPLHFPISSLVFVSDPRPLTALKFLLVNRFRFSR